MGKDDERASESRGRESRRADMKTWLQISSVVLGCAAILWQGGQMTEKLDAVVRTVNTVSVQVASQQVDQATIKARLENHDKEITNHETRIVRIENRDRRER